MSPQFEFSRLRKAAPHLICARSGSRIFYWESHGKGAQAASSELSRLLEQAIESLPENYRAVVMLRDVEELSTSEAAACLSLTEDNVKIRRHRAHGLLRKKLYAKAKISTAETFPFHAPRCDRVVSAVFAVLAALPASHAIRGRYQ